MSQRLVLAFIALLSSSSCFAEERHPYVSGSFYPNDKTELAAMVDGFLAEAQRTQSRVPPHGTASGKLIGLIVPHAGFIYSGKTAALAYAHLRENPAVTVVLIGPYHRGMFEGASVWKRGSWRTPLGEMKVDEALAGAIAGEHPSLGFNENAHAAEHSLETQIPFLQRTLPEAKIVPILISDPSAKNTTELARAVWKHIEGKNVVVIASTDMSHYYPLEKAKRMDKEALALLESGDAEKLREAILSRKVEFCGHAAVLTMLQIAKLADGARVKMLGYATSAEASGDEGRVVGYGAAAIYLTSPHGTTFGGERSSGSVELTADQRKTLFKLARETVEAHVSGKPLPKAPSDGIFGEPRGVFVTIRKNGELRGCIGRIVAELPLGEAVRAMAVESARDDPRFSPVVPGELKDLTYEVSVLSPPQKAVGASVVELGKHGVILRQGARSGVFLPKVAVETGWDKETFLGELCSQKAGLKSDCWKDPATELSVFTAEEFSE